MLGCYCCFKYKLYEWCLYLAAICTWCFCKDCLSEDTEDREDSASRAQFEFIDVDKSGFISRAELRKFLVQEVQVSEAQVDEFMDEIMRVGDMDGDQKINFEEFCKIMKVLLKATKKCHLPIQFL